MIPALLTGWFVMSVLGFITLPISLWIFKRLPDGGYTLARPLGLLFASYLLWIGASTHVIINNSSGVMIVLGVITAFSLFSIWKTGGMKSLGVNLSTKRKVIIASEILFFICLAIWTVVRAHTTVFRINPTGGEKFMEIAFLNGVLNSPTFPPQDPWLSGFGISYYYFGYVMMAFFTRFSGLSSEIAFDLYDALLFALTAAAAYGFSHNLVAAGTGEQKTGWKSTLFGIVGSYFLVGMGNLLGLIESLQARGWLVPALLRWLAVPGLETASVNGTFLPEGNLWWWRASRILNDLDLFGKTLGANPITEFPFFSFLLGDNHPHKLALPFVVLSVSIAYQVYLSAHDGGQPSLLRLIVAAFAVGSLAFLNTWDYPIYFLLVIGAWIASSLTRPGSRPRSLLWPAIRTGMILLVGMLFFYGFFFISFSSQAGGVLPNIYPPTRLVQFMIQFSPFIFILAFFLLTALRYNTSGANPASFPYRMVIKWWLRMIAVLLGAYFIILISAGIVMAIDRLMGGSLTFQVESWLGGLYWWEAFLRIIAFRLTNPWLFLLLTGLFTLSASVLWKIFTQSSAQRAAGSPIEPDLGLGFVQLLILLGIALVLSVEFVYLRDNFGVRMNTVFKFYFQAWVCFAFASGYALWWMVNNGKSVLSSLAWKIFWTGSVILVAGASVYPILATISRAGGFSGEAVVDGSMLLRESSPDDFAAIDWLRQNTPPESIILEAPGRAYDFEGRISAFTGHPTILGWSDHEAQWRGGYDEQAQREVDIAAIFSNPGSAQAQDLLRKWKVRYIIVGDTEGSYLVTLCTQPESTCLPERSLIAFDRNFPVVFEQGSVKIYAVDLLHP